MKKLTTILLLILSGMLIFQSCDSTNAPAKYKVAITAEPSAGGTVSPSSGTYKAGTTLNIMANPSDHWKFDHWSGDAQGTSPSATVTVKGPMNIIAHFSKTKYDLTIKIEGKGTVDQQVVQMETTTKNYDYGTQVQLTATPANGWVFKKWKGDLTGTDNPATITVKKPKTVTAVFKKKDYPLTVNTDGQGTVSEKVLSAKTTNYKYGTKVQLTAQPANGWKFVKWTGDLTGTDNPATINVKKPKTVTAVFKKKDFPLTIKTDGQGTVDETVISAKTTNYKFGTKVKLTAKAATHWTFKKWKGDLTGTDNPATITVKGPETVTAVFQKKFHAVSGGGGNGITIKCAAAKFGASGKVNGTTYTKRRAGQINASNAATTCTSGITDMSGLFKGKTSFNADISTWDVSQVKDMKGMFRGATSFNQDIGGWDVSQVKDMSHMFQGATSFNQDLRHWDTKNVETMSYMFAHAISFNWGIGNGHDIHTAFAGGSGATCTASWTLAPNSSGMFKGDINFNASFVLHFDVSNVINMSYMFAGARSFNQPIGCWDVSNVKAMAFMFYFAKSFNKKIGNWDVSSVTTMQGMFAYAKNFNKPLNSWGSKVGNVTNMEIMFAHATDFNKKIGNWDVSNVTTMNSMFAYTTSFDKPLSGWNNKLDNVTDMRRMFFHASHFGKDLSSWCPPHIYNKPYHFSTGSDLNSSDMPDWGACSQTPPGACPSMLQGVYKVEVLSTTSPGGPISTHQAEVIQGQQYGEYVTTSIGGWFDGGPRTGSLAPLHFGVIFTENCGTIKVNHTNLGNYYSNKVTPNGTTLVHPQAGAKDGTLNYFILKYHIQALGDYKVKYIKTGNISPQVAEKLRKKYAASKTTKPQKRLSGVSKLSSN